MKRTTKVLPSANTKKLLALNLLMSNCINALSDEGKEAYSNLAPLVYNVNSLAETKHATESLDEIHAVVKKYAETKDEEDDIPVATVIDLTMLSLSQTKLEGFYGLKGKTYKPAVDDFTPKEVASFLRFLANVDAAFNTKQYLNKVAPVMAKKKVVVKEKRARDKPKPKAKATKTKKLKMAKEPFIIRESKKHDLVAVLTDDTVTLTMTVGEMEYSVPVYDVFDCTELEFKRILKDVHDDIKGVLEN